MKRKSGSFSAIYITLGCKVNQYETENIRSSLEKLGVRTATSNERADVCIINTCTVTHTADSKSRAAINRAIRQNPDALVIVTGCYSQLEASAVELIEGVDAVVPNEQKETIADLIANNLHLHRKSSTTSHTTNSRLRTRAVVKVQDGCDNYCSYCIIPYARSKMISRSIGEVLDEIRGLVDSGFQEIVLTGIRLGSYSHNGNDLASLIKKSVQVVHKGRIRLSSIEPWEITDKLLLAMDSPNVCRHLHIPLQSGDDSILSAMNRQYTPESYLKLLENARGKLPGVGISSDVIVGFPGETDEMHQNSIQIVKEAGFARLHVFRYSRRKGTVAAEMPKQVSEQKKRFRSKQMEELGFALQKEFACSWIGKTLPVLIERQIKNSENFRGYSDNYIEINTALENKFVNKIIDLCVNNVAQDGRVFAKMLDNQG